MKTAVKPFRRLAGIAFSFAVVAVLTAMLIEIGARVWLNYAASDEQFRTFASYRQIKERTEKLGRPYTRHSPHRYLGYINSPNYVDGGNRHNSLGFRGNEILPKSAGEYRVVCVGGSTTYTTYVADHLRSYPALLEQNLHNAGLRHVRVINAGTPGYGTTETTISLLFRILDLNPDMVIIYHGINDVINRMVWPPETYRADNSGIFGPSAGFEQAVPWYERSTFLRVALIQAGLIESHASLARCFAAFPESAMWPRYVEQFHRGSYPEGVFEEVDALEMLEANPPTYFERNMENLIGLLRFRNIQPVLISLALCTKVPGHNNSPVFIQGVQEHNAITEQLAELHDVPFFDFAEVFPNEARLFHDPDHVNEEGVELKAELITEFLLQQALIPPLGEKALSGAPSSLP